MTNFISTATIYNISNNSNSHVLCSFSGIELTLTTIILYYYLETCILALVSICCIFCLFLRHQDVLHQIFIIIISIIVFTEYIPVLGYVVSIISNIP